MRRFKVPCRRHVVLEALVAADDFMTAAQISERTGITARDATSALHNLRYCKAVEFVEAEGRLWWFATPASDTRTKHFEERAPETRPRAKRRRRPKV